MDDRKAILVIGGGDATGGAVARRFAREGYVACVTRRSDEKLAQLVEREIAPLGVAVFNVGANAGCSEPRRLGTNACAAPPSSNCAVARKR